METNEKEIEHDVSNAEIDLTDKVKNLIRFGLVGLMALGIAIGVFVWNINANSGKIIVNDAKVASVMVGVRTKASGTVTEILVQDGDQIEAGTIVARLKVDVTEEQIQQLENTVELSKRNLEEIKKGTIVTVQSESPVITAKPVSPSNNVEVINAKRRLERMNQLLEMGAVSVAERDAAAADLAAAQANASAESEPVKISRSNTVTRTVPASPEAIQQAELAVKQAEMALQLARTASTATEIVADISGIVYLGNVNIDSEVKAGQTIMKIGEKDSLWVEAYLAPEKRDAASLGQLVTYNIDGKQYKGTVIDIIDPEEAVDTEVVQPTATEGTSEVNENSNESGNENKKITVKISVPAEDITNVKPEQRAEVIFG